MNGDGDKRKPPFPSCPRLTSCSPEFVHAPPWNLRFIDERLLGFG